MDENPRAQEVAQEAVTEPFAAVRPRNQARNVGDDEGTPFAEPTTPKWGTNVVNG